MSSQVLKINKQRIFIRDIRSYELDSDELYYRNEIEAGFLHSIFGNPDELWDEYSFDYLYIELKNGETYYLFSDEELKELMEEMGDYFKERQLKVEDCAYKSPYIYYNNDDIERETEEDKNLEEAIGSFVRIKDTFEFASDDISNIVNKLDEAFGCI